MKPSDFLLLDDLLDNYGEQLKDHSIAAFRAFSEWRQDFGADPDLVLTQKQSAWLYGVAERLGVIAAAPSENVFSTLSPTRQAEQRKRAMAVKLPWEQNVGDEVVRFLVGKTDDGRYVVREVRARFVEHDGKRGYVCQLRSCERSSMIEWIPEEKVYESAMTALARKKELERK